MRQDFERAGFELIVAPSEMRHPLIVRPAEEGAAVGNCCGNA